MPAGHGGGVDAARRAALRAHKRPNSPCKGEGTIAEGDGERVGTADMHIVYPDAPAPKFRQGAP